VPGAQPVVDEAALARAFWPWAATFDDNAQLEPYEPVDYAHYACGVLLAQLLRQRPLRLGDARLGDARLGDARPGDGRPGDAALSPEAARSAEIRVLTGVALTLLAAWRQALGAEPLEAGLQAELRAGAQAHWASYLENLAEDANIAVAFLDLFTGREPVWRYPLVLVERAPFRRALAQRRAPTA
jgi:hypothetical protein